METSILTSTKKILGVSADYTVFDLGILTHLNSTFSTLNQLGIGPAGGLSIEDSGAEWDDLGIPPNRLNMVKTYVFLKVRMLFDPPTTSFHIEAMDKQIAEHEFRLTVYRESDIPSKAVNVW